MPIASRRRWGCDRASRGERLEGRPGELPVGTLVVADQRRPIALLFGAIASGRGVNKGSKRMLLTLASRSRACPTSPSRRPSGLPPRRCETSVIGRPALGCRSGAPGATMDASATWKGPGADARTSRTRTATASRLRRPCAESPGIRIAAARLRTEALATSCDARSPSSSGSSASSSPLPSRGVESSGPSAPLAARGCSASASWSASAIGLAGRLADAKREIARRADAEESGRALVERMIADPDDYRWVRVSQRGRRRARLQALALAAAVRDPRDAARLVAGKALLRLPLSRRARLMPRPAPKPSPTIVTRTRRVT